MRRVFINVSEQLGESDTADGEEDKLDKNSCDVSAPPNETPYDRQICIQHSLGMMMLKWREMYQKPTFRLSDLPVDVESFTAANQSDQFKQCL